jgi:hypothetical protein
MSETGSDIDSERAARAANLFDLRRIIGGLFLVYGTILAVLGAGASEADIERAAGVNVNLWTGLAMLAVGALFLLWAFARPLAQELEEGAGSEPAGGTAGGDRESGGGRGDAGSEEG